MTVSSQTAFRAIDLLAAVEGVEMDSRALADDVLLLAVSFPDEDNFKCAVASTCKELRHIAAHKTTDAPLKYSYEGWLSHHYQHRRAQGQNANMRIVYTWRRNVVRVRGFGHRHLPFDIYDRLSEGDLWRNPFDVEGKASSLQSDDVEGSET